MRKKIQKYAQNFTKTWHWKQNVTMNRKNIVLWPLLILDLLPSFKKNFQNARIILISL